MAKRRLPIGMQTFRTLRERDCYYVDKTAYIERLLDEGTHYFLSRPRRFGKSLFLDTLKELFEGSQALFAGLHIHERYAYLLEALHRHNPGSGLLVDLRLHRGRPGHGVLPGARGPGTGSVCLPGTTAPA